MALVVAPAGPGDPAAVLSHRRETGWASAETEGEVWVAREQGVVVGSLQLIDISHVVVLVDAVVVPESQRGNGIGELLMKGVLATRMTDWWLECREERLTFYARLGFLEVGIDEVPTSLRTYLAGPGRIPSDREHHFMRLDRAPKTVVRDGHDRISG